MSRRASIDDAAFNLLREEIRKRTPQGIKDKRIKIRERLFQQQLDFLNDPSQFKSLLGNRRCGKTTSNTTIMLDRALVTDSPAKILFLALTRKHAKQLVWSELKRLTDDFEIECKYNNVDLQVTFPWGTTIEVTGADDSGDIDKKRGLAYDLIIIDECASFEINMLDELVKEVLTPTLDDRMGTLCLTGTPGPVLTGTFYEATHRNDATRPWAERDTWPEDKPYQWSFHSWQSIDNVKMPHIWQAQLARKKSLGIRDNDPIWIREYLGQWINDNGAFVYRYQEERDGWEPLKAEDTDNPHGLPIGHEWKYLAGLDLGYDADFALNVGAYSDTCDTLYHVYGYSSPGLIVPDIARKYREVEAIFGEFEITVGDRGGLGKTILATLEEQYGISVVAAEKSEKRDHIELLNGDLVSGRAKILKNSKLAQEMKSCQWDDTGKKEQRSCAHDNCDSFLYLWRYCLHHYARERDELPEPGSVKHGWLMMEEARKRAVERKLRRQSQEWWDTDEPLDGAGVLDLEADLDS